MMHQTHSKIYLLLFLTNVVNISLSCQDTFQQQDWKHSVVYVEAKTDEGIYAGAFGEVVILNIDTKEKYYITNDNYFDNLPKWSPKGDSIVFLTNRVGNDFSLKVKGVAGPHNLFLYSLLEKKLSKAEIPFQIERPEYLRTKIYNFDWLSKLNLISFRDFQNTFYTCKLDGEKLFEINNHEIRTIFTIKYSNNCKNIVFDFQGSDDINNSGLRILNLTDSSSSISLHLPNISTLFGWSLDDGYIYFSELNKIKRYDLSKNEITDFYIIEEKLEILEWIQLSEDEFIILAEYEQKVAEIGILNVKKNQIIWLTDDKKEKEGLDLFIKY